MRLSFRGAIDNAKAVRARDAAPQQWSPADLKAITQRTIDKMITDGWLVVKDMKELMAEPGRFRKGRGLTVDKAHT
jgi:hypothetical protein